MDVVGNHRSHGTVTHRSRRCSVTIGGVTPVATHGVRASLRISQSVLDSGLRAFNNVPSGNNNVNYVFNSTLFFFSEMLLIQVTLIKSHKV